MIKQFLVFIIIFLALSCCKNNEKINKSNKVESLTPTDYIDDSFNNKKYMDSLITEFIRDGDTIAYKKARNIYFIAEQRTSFLFYSLMMSNKHSYKSSYYDIYFILTTGDKNALDEKTSKMADYYLFKAYEKGSKDAKRIVEKRLGKPDRSDMRYR